MTDLVIFIPSRGRPHTVAELDEALDKTCIVATTLAILVLDEDDPELDAYDKAVRGCHRIVHYYTQPTGTMVSALNYAAVSSDFGSSAIGFMGDDHRPRTVGWDKAYLDALHELGTGIVYGNDLLQGENLPTQCAMTADIVRELGYMAPPALRHMYVDNYWRDLGRGAGCLRYLPDVVVEHMHPIAGKAEWTDGHRRVNSRAIYAADEAAYRHHLQTGMARDIETVRGLR